MLNTDQLMEVANDLAGFSETPADSRIFVPGENIRRVLIGIDINAGHLLAAQQLGYDAVIAHHPYDRGLTSWPVYLRHLTFLQKHGVPQAEAEQAVLPRVESLKLAAHPVNYDELPSLARLLHLPFLNVHCPCDELGRQAMQLAVDVTLREHPQATVQQVAAALFASYAEFGLAEAKMQVMLGDEAAAAGNVVVAHGCYTNGGATVAEAYFRHGVDTLIYIHIMPEELAKLRQANLHGKQLLVVGHLAADSIGINAYSRELRQRGLEVTPTSGVLEQL